MGMECVYASPDVMEENDENKRAGGQRKYPMSRAADDMDDRERRLLTDTIYDAPDFTAAMSQRLKEEEPVMECVYASPEMMERTEFAPEKKRGLFSRLFGRKRK